MSSYRRNWLVALCAFASLMLVTVGTAEQGNSSPATGVARIGKEKGYEVSELDKAPPKVRDRRNPLEHDPDAVATGRKLFSLHCAECHGESASGTRRAPSLREPEVQDAPSGAIFWVLTNGIVWHGMPVWSKLPEPQRWQLATYIKSLGPKAETLPSR